MKTLWNQYEQAHAPGVASDPWRLRYHLMPPVGWLNDPNGLCEKDGVTHIFYQYSPLEPAGGQKGWGHYTTPDWKTFESCPIELVPDSPLDKDGVYSGSAFVKDDTIHFFYTGNIKEEGDFDYIYEGRGHYVNTFTSGDGLTFSEKRNVLKNEEYPHDLSCHVRDPKIFEENGVYYMVLGARTRNDVGQILVYRSDDLAQWSFHGRLESDAPFGYMWECPDLFELDGQKILMTCPQGVEQDGYRFENVYQNGYFLVDGALDEHTALSSFAEFDHGFDFYAPQTYLDTRGRRILIGWMGIPDAEYSNPTVANGWQHALTLPRTLWLENGRLYQFPIVEVLDLKRTERSQKLQAGETVDIGTPCFHATLSPLTDSFHICLREDCEIEYANGLLTFSLKQSGYGRDARHIEVGQIETLDVFSDTSSVEIFVNGGQYALTSRIYDNMELNKIVSDGPMELVVRAMDAYRVGKDNYIGSQV